MLSLVALGFTETRASAVRLLVLIGGLQFHLGEQGTTIVSGPLRRACSSYLPFWVRVLSCSCSNSEESQRRQLQVIREDLVVQKADQQ